jgi:hypothetical protein
MEICNQALMDFVAAAKIRKFPPWHAEERGQKECGQVKPWEEGHGQKEHVQEQSGQQVCKSGGLQSGWSLFWWISFVLLNLLLLKCQLGRWVAGSSSAM